MTSHWILRDLVIIHRELDVFILLFMSYNSMALNYCCMDLICKSPKIKKGKQNKMIHALHRRVCPIQYIALLWFLVIDAGIVIS